MKDEFIRDPMIKSIVSYINDHIEEDLPLDKIAKELHYSKFYMARTFAEKTGCTIYKYIQGAARTGSKETCRKWQTHC